MQAYIQAFYYVCFDTWSTYDVGNEYSNHYDGYLLFLDVSRYA